MILKAIWFSIKFLNRIPCLTLLFLESILQSIPIIRNAILSSDGNIILVGHGVLGTAGNHIIIKKFNVDGEKIWVKGFPSNGGGEIRTIEKDNENIVIGGDISSINNSSGLFIMELDKFGELLSQKEFGSKEERFHDLIQTYSGDFVIAGAKGPRDSISSKYSTFALKLNPVFDSIWLKTYIPDSLNFQIANTFSNNSMASSQRVQGSTITEAYNGDLLIFGGKTTIVYGQTIDDSLYINDGVLIRADMDGNEKWHKSISTVPTKYRAAQSSLLNQNNQLLAGGDYFVIKLDSLGIIIDNVELSILKEREILAYPNPFFKFHSF